MKANIYPGRGSWPDWNDLDIRQREQMPAHAYRIPFPDLASCRHAVLNNRRYLSPYIVCLNDGWESRSYASILQLPENILSFRSGFESAEVPTGRLSGSAQAAAGEAEGYPFPVTPPRVPSEQPVLVYRRTCRLPLLWGGLRKRLVLQGVRSACHLFINGRLAGYTQGSCLPAEFDLTAGLHDGDNELFILAYPCCDGSYLEKQDSGSLFGLIREAYFEAVAPIVVQDIQSKTVPVPDEEAWRLDLAIRLISYRISTESPQVRVSLWQEGECLSNTVWTAALNQADAVEYASPVQTEGLLQASILLPNIESWSDESPRLYDLFIGIEERGSRELFCTHLAVGFRQLTWQNGKALLNGKPLQLRSVQWYRPQSDPIRELIQELMQIRKTHFNALYIRHQPADPILLELCDIFGLYVIDEAPLEISHPLLEAEMQRDPRWLEAAGERLERLVRRDFNHPCVLFWSAGILRQRGPLADALADFVRRLDDTRGLHLVDLPDLSRNLADVPVSEKLKYPDAGGICCCDWDRCPEILRRELKQILRPIDIRPIDATAGTFMIVNRLNWTPASQYQFTWLLQRDGRPIMTGELDNIRTEPGSEQYIELIYGDRDFYDGSDYILIFRILYNESSLWAEAGDEACHAEFPLVIADRSEVSAPARSGGRLRLESDRHHLIVSGSRFWLVFNRITSTLESWRFGDKEIIASYFLPDCGISGLHGTISRLPEPLDKPWIAIWRQAGYDSLMTQVISSQEGCDGQSAVIEMVVQLAAPGMPACLELLLRYEIRASGDLRVFTSLNPLLASQPPWPCFGLGLNLKSDYNRISWYGTGPECCLSSLQNSRRSGLFTGIQVDQAKGVNLPGDKPGQFPDTRWMTFKDYTGFGLMIRSDQLFGFTVRPIGLNGSLSGLAEARPERQALAVQLYQQLAAAGGNKPVKASWYFTPVVSDAGRQQPETTGR